MFVTPYDTNVGKTYNLNSLISDILARKSQFSNAPFEVTKANRALVTFVTDDIQGVSYFNQVLMIEDAGQVSDVDPHTFFVDIRQMARMDKQHRLRWNSTNEREFAYARAFFTAGWVVGGAGEFLGALDFSLKVYAEWLVRAVSRLYAHDLATNVRLSVIAGLFYLSAFEKPGVIDDNEARRVATKLARILAIPVEQVHGIVSDVGYYLNGIQELADAMKNHGESVALTDINAAKLYTALGGTWYGAAAQEHVAVAIEYPPTLFAMIWTAIHDKSYRKTIIGDIVRNNERNPNLRAFLTTLRRLRELENEGE